MAKRTFDIAMSIIGLIVFSPLLIVTAFVILFTSGWPVLYSPTRAGRLNKPFILRKFRSMRFADGPISHHSGDDDPRITNVGRYMRKFKVDELPQLWNVVKGDMSLVGPRPETTEYIEHYTPEQQVILEARPGITDFASIEFADLGSFLKGDDPDKMYFEKVWDRKMELRMKYVQERTFWIDLSLLFQTFSAVFRRSN